MLVRRQLTVARPGVRTWLADCGTFESIGTCSQSAHAGLGPVETAEGTSTPERNRPLVDWGTTRRDALRGCFRFRQAPQDTPSEEVSG